MKPFLLIDSGATKLQWLLANAQSVLAEGTLPGLHPFLTHADTWQQALSDLTLALAHFPTPAAVYYYGTGCAQPAGRQQIAEYFRMHAPVAAPTHIETDLLAAARALCQRAPGICCILGTGSNAAYYDGTQVSEQRGGLGYVLGDEGSGASIGKIFLQTYLNHQLPQHWNDQLLDEGLDRSAIISELYRTDSPSRYLAAYAPKALAALPESPALHARIVADYTALCHNALLPLAQLSALDTVHFTGSVAVHFSVLIADVLADCGLCVGRIEQQPIALLLQYHQHRDGK